MKTVKVSDLSGPALDWAVAECDGMFIVPDSFPQVPRAKLTKGGIILGYDEQSYAIYYSPSCDWAQGGPIIERERVDTVSLPREYWRAQSVHGARPCVQYGPTPLIAAMRCYVASRLGDTIEIPSELIP